MTEAEARENIKKYGESHAPKSVGFLEGVEHQKAKDRDVIVEAQHCWEYLKEGSGHDLVLANRLEKALEKYFSTEGK